MQTKSKVLELASLLRKNELLLADYYHECSQLFPDFAEKLKALQAEEQGHAKMYDCIIQNIEENPENWKPGKVSAQTLKLMNERIQESMAEVKSGKAAPKFAITSLLSFEQSLGEYAIEKILINENEEFKNHIKKIKEGFKKHYNYLLSLKKQIFR